MVASENKDQPPLTGELIDGQFGYLKMLSYKGTSPSDQSLRYTQKAHELIRTLDDAGVCGWVLDLRDNLGGNMWPMLAAIGPILGHRNLGGHLDSDHSEPSTWWYRDGKAGVTVRGSSNVRAEHGPQPFYSETASNLPFAVIFGSSTSSSGEGVLIATKSHPLSRTFSTGQSGGYATGNSPLPLSDGAILNLTTAYTVDTDGNVYGDAVMPDEKVVPTSEFDSVLGAAKEWIQSQNDCRNEHHYGE